MSNEERIQRTLDRKRGYRWWYHWKTEYYTNKEGDEIFEIYDGGVMIFAFNMTEGFIINDYKNVSGYWDKEWAANMALHKLQKMGYVIEDNITFYTIRNVYGVYKTLDLPHHKGLDESWHRLIYIPYFPEDYQIWLNAGGLKVAIKSALNMLDIKNIMFTIENGYIAHIKGYINMAMYAFETIHNAIGLLDIKREENKVIVTWENKEEDTQERREEPIGFPKSSYSLIMED